MRKMSRFNFNGIDSLSIGLILQGAPAYSGAQRDISYESIPGRDGDIIIDNGRYNNIDLKYPCAIVPAAGRTMREAAHAIRVALLSNVGYFRLYDTSDELYYRMASYSDAADIEKQSIADGKIEIAFNCKPYRYSIAGLDAIRLTASASLYNPEAFPSLPYIKVTGSGAVTLTVAGTAHSFTIDDGYIEIDSELMNAYKGTTLKNNMMTTTAFPKLLPGCNTISWTGNVSAVEITPRWRTL